MKKLLIGFLIIGAITISSSCANKEVEDFNINEVSTNEVDESDQVIESTNYIEEADKEEYTEVEIIDEDILIDESIDVSNKTDEKIEEPLKIESNKVVDTEIDFSVYRLNPETDRNDTNIVLNEDEFLLDVYNKLIEFHSIYYINIIGYSDDKVFEETNGISIDKAIKEMQNRLDYMDNYNSLMHTYMYADLDLLNYWDSFYQEINKNKDILYNLNTEDIQKFKESTVNVDNKTLKLLIKLSYKVDAINNQIKNQEANME